MDATERSFNLEIMLKLLQLASYSIPAIYLLGFIVVNSYIFQFGTISLSIFDSRIISAGISFAFLILPLVYLLFYLTEKNIYSNASNVALVSIEFNLIIMLESFIVFSGAFNSIISAIFAFPYLILMLIFVTYSVIVKMIASRYYGLDKKKSNTFFIICTIINIVLFWCLLDDVARKYYFFMGAIFLIASLISSYYYNDKSSIGHFMNMGIGERVRSLFMAIMFMIVFASTFGKLFYPFIPPYYGGGALKNVEIVLKEPDQYEKIFNIKKSELKALKEYGEDNNYVSFICVKNDGKSYLVKVNKEYIASRISR